MGIEWVQVPVYAWAVPEITQAPAHEFRALAKLRSTARRGVPARLKQATEDERYSGSTWAIF